ncbi:MAG: 4Fe-4S binding protein, partial [Candidatus Latescibacterota bacterium]
MCQFCTKHGEGKKWYLQMSNYSRELLSEELPAQTQEMAGAQTRLQWLEGFVRGFVMPAITGRPPAQQAAGAAGGAAAEQPQTPPPTAEDILAERQAVHFGQVLPVEDVEQVIDQVDSVTRMPCGCRFMSTGKADKRYCFGLGVDCRGILGKFPEASSSLEVLEKEEAKQVIRDYDEEGLVHSIWTGVTPYVIGVCNCDRDCMAYKGYIEQRGLPHFFRAEYVGQVDWDQCTGCKSCVSQCQFGAEFYSSALGKVFIDPTRCFGCGACRAACAHDAITLVPRQQHPEAADLWLGPATKTLCVDRRRGQGRARPRPTVSLSPFPSSVEGRKARARGRHK